MMDDVKRALLGDHEAAKRLTDAGGACAVSYVRSHNRQTSRKRHPYAE